MFEMTVGIKYTDSGTSGDMGYKREVVSPVFRSSFSPLQALLFCSKRNVNFAMYNQKYWFSMSCWVLPDSLVSSLQVQEVDLSYRSLSLCYFDRLNTTDDFLRSKLGALVLKFSGQYLNLVVICIFLFFPYNISSQVEANYAAFKGVVTSARPLKRVY